MCHIAMQEMEQSVPDPSHLPVLNPLEGVPHLDPGKWNRVWMKWFALKYSAGHKYY